MAAGGGGWEDTGYECCGKGEPYRLDDPAMADPAPNPTAGSIMHCGVFGGIGGRPYWDVQPYASLFPIHGNWCHGVLKRRENILTNTEQARNNACNYTETYICISVHFIYSCIISQKFKQNEM